MKVIICCSRLTSFIQTDYSIKQILRLVVVPGTFFSDPCSRTTTTVYQKFHVICSASQLKMQVEPQLDLAVSGCHSHTPPACFFYFFFYENMNCTSSIRRAFRFPVYKTALYNNPHAKTAVPKP